MRSLWCLSLKCLLLTVWPDDNVPTAYWSVLEAFVSIICTCLPAIRALLRKVFPTCFGSSSDPNSHNDITDDSRGYRFSKSPLHSGNDMAKTMGHSVRGTAGSGDSDKIELVQRNGDMKDPRYHGPAHSTDGTC